MPRIWFRRREQQRHVLQEQEQLQRERQALALAYRQTFSTPHGQEVLAHLLRQGGVMQSSFDPNPAVAAYTEGRRRMALEIVEMLNADPAQVNAMVLTGETESLFTSTPKG